MLPYVENALMVFRRMRTKTLFVTGAVLFFTVQVNDPLRATLRVRRAWGLPAQQLSACDVSHPFCCCLAQILLFVSYHRQIGRLSKARPACMKGKHDRADTRRL